MAGRAKPDPAVGVADLMKPFIKVCVEAGSWDLQQLLFPGESTRKLGWKSAAEAAVVSRETLCQLCMGLFQVSNSGVFASKKLKAALWKLQTEEHRLNYSRKADSDYFDRLDEQIRIVCAQYRVLKKDQLAYARFCRKCSSAEKDRVDSVLAFLDLGEEAATDESTAMVSKLAEASKAEDLEEKGLESPGIFSKVLAKLPNEEASPLTGTKSQSSKDKPGLDFGLSPHRVKLKRSLEQFYLDDDQEAELAQWMAEPSTLVKPPVVRKSKQKAAQKKPASSSAAQQQGSGPKVTAGPFLKSTWVQRRGSSVYHKAKLQATQRGLSPESAKAEARSARAAWKEKVDSGEIIPSQE